MKSMRSELPDLKGFALSTNSKEIDSRTVYFAIEGTQVDGHQFIPEADERGAPFIIGTRALSQKTRAPYIQVADSRLALAEASALSAEFPSLKMRMIGVTGTSGKTTTAYLIESILKANGERVGLIGTIEHRINGKPIPSTHTTPGPIELQKLLKRMLDEGCTSVVMEVSSHAIAQQRTACIAFDGTVFTNLSPEHLDFHPDMNHYFETKARLFKEYFEFAVVSKKKPVRVINEEDDYGKKLLAQLKGEKSVSSFQSKSLRSSLQGIEGEVNGLPIRSSLVGAFNQSNIAGAVTLCQALKIDATAISRGVQALHAVPRRLERVVVDHPKKLQVFVDYAHKPDALEKVLTTLQGMAGGRAIVTVMGCGGDRDKTKRPVMGAIAARKSSLTFVTSDNPRTENPKTIIEEILNGIKNRSNVRAIEDRKEAITEAIRSAPENAIILIAGKGHENYQIIGTEKKPFDDREVAKQALSQMSAKR